MKDYHCCATCRHFKAARIDGEMSYRCMRLGYETKPDYKFDCWSPRDEIRTLIEKRSADS